MSRVRIGIDIDITKGKDQEVIDAIFDNRKKIADFIANVVLVNDSRTSEYKTGGVGLNAHKHPETRDQLSCNDCMRYADRVQLADLGD